MSGSATVRRAQLLAVPQRLAGGGTLFRGVVAPLDSVPEAPVPDRLSLLRELTESARRGDTPEALIEALAGPLGTYAEAQVSWREADAGGGSAPPDGGDDVLAVDVGGRAWGSVQVQADSADLSRELSPLLALALQGAVAQRLWRRASAQLPAREAFYAAGINLVPQGIYVKDDARRWVLANDACCEVLGVPRERLLGHTAGELLAPDVAARIDAEDTEAFGAQGAATFQKSPANPFSPQSWLQKTKAPVTMPDGRRYLVCGFVDMTRSQEASRGLERSHQFLPAVLNALPVGRGGEGRGAPLRRDQRSGRALARPQSRVMPGPDGLRSRVRVHRAHLS